MGPSDALSKLSSEELSSSKSVHIFVMKLLVASLLIAGIAAFPNRPTEAPGNIKSLQVGAGGEIVFSETASFKKLSDGILHPVVVDVRGPGAPGPKHKLREGIPDQFNDYIVNPDGSLSYVIKGPGGVHEFDAPLADTPLETEFRHEPKEE